MRVEAVGPGDQCATGGMLVSQGHDANHNGTLDNDEVDSTQVVCELGPTTIDGSYTAQNAIDLAWVAQTQQITGTLVIGTQGLASVELPALKEVGGLMVFGVQGLQSVSLPALETVHGDLVVNSVPDLDELDLTALTSVEGGVNVGDTPSLPDLSGLSALEDIGGDLIVSETGPLNAVPTTDPLPGVHDFAGMTSLQTIGGRLRLLSGALTGLAGLENVHDLAGLQVQGAQALPSLDGLGGLTQLGGDLTVMNDLDLSDISALDGLTGIDGNVQVMFDPVLPECDVQALMDTIGANNITGSVTITGDAPCAQ